MLLYQTLKKKLELVINQFEAINNLFKLAARRHENPFNCKPFEFSGLVG